MDSGSEGWVVGEVDGVGGVGEAGGWVGGGLLACGASGRKTRLVVADGAGVAARATRAVGGRGVGARVALASGVGVVGVGAMKVAVGVGGGRVGRTGGGVVQAARSMRVRHAHILLTEGTE